MASSSRRPVSCSSRGASYHSFAVTDSLEVAQIKSVAHAYLSPYDVVDEAETVPAEPEVAPAEEAAPAKQVNGDVSEAKVNGVASAAEAPADEHASQSSSQPATPPLPEAEAASAPVPAADQSWADDQPEATTEVRFDPL